MTRRGADISSNNPHPIDWGAVRAGGWGDFVIVKATEGTGYRNPFFVGDCLGAAAAGIPSLAYHYADFADPVAEARWFRTVVPGDGPWMLDIEGTDCGVNWIVAFAQAASGYGLTYGSGSNPTLAALGAAGYSLDVAEWGPNGPTLASSVCWQFTDAARIPGIGGAVDGNEWIGDDASFARFFGGPTPPPLPPPAPAPVVVFWEDNVTRIGPLTVHLDANGNGWITDPAITDVTKVIDTVFVANDPPSSGAYVHLPTGWGIDPTRQAVVIEGGVANGNYGAFVWAEV